MNHSVGTVETRYVKLQQPFRLESEAVINQPTIAYETYGQRGTSRDNTILVCHALSGDAHAAGFHRGEDRPGWWDDMIGPGKAFDTRKYFVVCSNILGGCKGTTGPGSINPRTGKPYGLSFPVVTINDMVRLQKLLLDYLGIERLLCVTGGSMGGMQALEWAVSFPRLVSSCIPIAATCKHSAQQIAFDEVGRQAIMSDPNWKAGDYYGSQSPSRGLAVARMIGHITYMSDRSMEQKFGRLRKKKEYGYEFAQEFEVEGYLKYRGNSFIQRFDPNSYLYITRAMDYFDLPRDLPLTQVFKDVKQTKFLLIAFSSDWLYPPYQSKQIVKALKMNGIDVSYCEISSDYGHDAFLLEFEEQTRLITHFLKRAQNSTLHALNTQPG
ncbi:MAG: homoserine O-acetyltransferase MetX [Spirochaetota bacterium]